MKFLVFLLLSFGLIADDIDGFWKTIDEKTGKPRCVVGIYEYDGMYYGRIISTYNEDGTFKESIYAPKERAPGVIGNPFYCGLDFILYLMPASSSYKGKIMDPEHGKIYNAELWTEGDNLIVRGKLLMFGRNQTWLPVSKEDFPKDFKMPDLSTFKPTIPQVK